MQVMPIGSTELAPSPKRGELGESKKSKAVLHRVARNLGLNRHKGRGVEIATVVATAVGAPALIYAGQRVIRSRTARGLTVATAGLTMQAAKSKGVNRSGKILMVLGTGLALYGMFESLGGPDSSAQEPSK